MLIMQFGMKKILSMTPPKYKVQRKRLDFTIQKYKVKSPIIIVVDLRAKNQQN